MAWKPFQTVSLSSSSRPKIDPILLLAIIDAQFDAKPAPGSPSFDSDAGVLRSLITATVVEWASEAVTGLCQDVAGGADETESTRFELVARDTTVLLHKFGEILLQDEALGKVCIPVMQICCFSEFASDPRRLSNPYSPPLLS